MTSIILSIGDELTLGQTIDTNSAWLSQQLASLGCDIICHTTVPDDKRLIELAIRQAAGRCDYLLISGGIGPTEDDLTRQALASAMGAQLVLSESWLAKLKEFFHARGREMPEMNRVQALHPEGAKMIENSAGTAAGIDAVVEGLAFHSGPRARDEYMLRMFGDLSILQGKIEQALQKIPTRVFVMPGVPKEMKIMFTSYIRPILEQQSAGQIILSKTLHTFGLGESSIAEKLGDLMNRTRNPSVGTTVANGIVSLRINARFHKNDAPEQLAQTESACRAALGDLIFGSEDDTLQSVVASLLTQHSGLSTQHSSPRTVSTAESCTGGLLAKLLTDIPGSSSYFTQGWITYSNDAKHDRLGVSENLLKIHGAVSEPVVSAMATAAKRLSKSDFALAISGVAGPTGGTPAKPVGTVCIALASPPNSALSTQDSAFVTARTFNLSGDREMIRDRAAKMALSMLRFHLLDKPMPF